jgi:choline-sulfatase
MHFVGPDQLHGFEERLTTDIYPADFGWTPDYRKPGERIDWWYHNLGSVTGAGVAEITNQLEYDDEVAFHAVAEALRPGARARRPALVPDGQLHPSARPLRRAAVLGPLRGLRAPRAPVVGPIPYEARTRTPAADRRLRLAELRDHPRPRAPRAPAYFANISYIDDKIGELLAVLEATGRRPSWSSSRTTATCWASAGCGSR